MTALEFSRMPDVVGEGLKAAQEHAAPSWRRCRSRRRRMRSVCRRSRAPGEPRRASLLTSAQRPFGTEARRVEAVFGDLAGKPLDTPDLQKRLARQYRLDRFESVDYRLVGNEAERGLEIDLRRKSWGPAFLRLGWASRTTTKAAPRRTRRHS